MTKIVLTTIVAAICFLAAVVGGIVAYQYAAPSEAPAYGAADILTMNTIPTATSVWIGKDINSLLVATNTARTYLEIGSYGATSTAQTLYCNTNGRAGSLYSGFTIAASSTKIFNLDNNYTGALYCLAAGASSTVTVIER